MQAFALGEGLSGIRDLSVAWRVISLFEQRNDLIAFCISMTSLHIGFLTSNPDLTHQAYSFTSCFRRYSSPILSCMHQNVDPPTIASRHKHVLATWKQEI